MAGAREIRTKIKSVGNTRKVTRALEMVSASKIRKAQDLMKASRPYARAMKQVIGHVAKANSEFRHPFLETRDGVKRVGYIIVSTDRGLAGGLNSNMFRKVLTEIREWQSKGAEVDIIAIGSKANGFFRRLKVNLVGSVSHLNFEVFMDKTGLQAVHERLDLSAILLRKTRRDENGAHPLGREPAVQQVLRARDARRRARERRRSDDPGALAARRQVVRLLRSVHRESGRRRAAVVPVPLHPGNGLRYLP